MALIFRPTGSAGTSATPHPAGDRAGAAAAPAAPVGARIPGIAHPLPPGERVLWHGQPDPGAVRRHVFKMPLLAGYLGAMVLVWAIASRGDAEFVKKAVLLAGACALALGYVWWVAALTAQHTVYAITDRRVVLQIGLAFTSLVNIPLRLIESVSLATHDDGTGHLAMTLPAGERLAYALLWPHARPWRFTRPEPMLRAIREPERVGAILAQALAATVESPSPGVTRGAAAGSDGAPPTGARGSAAAEGSGGGGGTVPGATHPAEAERGEPAEVAALHGELVAGSGSGVA